MDTREQEVTEKLGLMRSVLHRTQAAAIRLRSTDWFAWATAGGSNTVLLTQETGVAEVLVTPTEAIILTDSIEARRLENEEIPGTFRIHADRWMDAAARDEFVQRLSAGRAVLSDRPGGGDWLLPDELCRRKLILMPSEQARYREIGYLASAAMDEVLRAARPEWTEAELAGAGAAALWARNLHPALTLAAGERRSSLYRHPTPKLERLGDMAMLVFCARGYGLYANLTRFVSFKPLTQEQQERHRLARQVETRALAICQAGVPLSVVYEALANGYHAIGSPHAITEHHQGGVTGYLAREIIMTTDTDQLLRAGMAIAINPSLAGAKIEDTFLINDYGLPENLTLGADWPVERVNGLARPLPLESA